MPDITTFCVDNSPWSANTDYQPSRLQCTKEAVHAIAKHRDKVSGATSYNIISRRCTSWQVIAQSLVDLGALASNLEGLQPDLTSTEFQIDKLLAVYYLLRTSWAQQGKHELVIFVNSPLKVDEVAVKAVMAKWRNFSPVINLVHCGCEVVNVPALEILYKLLPTSINSTFYNIDKFSNVRTTPASLLIHIQNTQLLPTGNRISLLDDEMDEDMARALRESLLEVENNPKKLPEGEEEEINKEWLDNQWKEVIGESDKPLIENDNINSNDKKSEDEVEEKDDKSNVTDVQENKDVE